MCSLSLGFTTNPRQDRSSRPLRIEIEGPSLEQCTRHTSVVSMISSVRFGPDKSQRPHQGCRFPGCTHKKYTDAHHIHHWAKGGETKMSNLVTLCRFHHRKVHEGQVVVQVLDDGAIRFVQPNAKASTACRLRPATGANSPQLMSAPAFTSMRRLPQRVGTAARWTMDWQWMSFGGCGGTFQLKRKSQFLGVPRRCAT
jgi:hypothetical protein